MTAHVLHCTEAPAGPTLAEIETWPATVDVGQASSALGLSRSWGYQLVAQDEFPCEVIKIGNRARVLTASLLRVLKGSAR